MEVPLLPRNLFAPRCPESNPGTRVKKELLPRVDEKGRLSLVPGADYDTDAFIQSWKESTDMAWILSRLANGDTSVLSQSSPMYGDFTTTPKTLAEALQLRIDANNAFDRLSDELKAKFDYNPDEFFRSAGDTAWFDKLGVSFGDQSAPAAALVQDNEKEVNFNES